MTQLRITTHAAERFVERIRPDLAGEPIETVRELLEGLAADAVPLRDRTGAGDEVWAVVHPPMALIVTRHGCVRGWAEVVTVIARDDPSAGRIDWEWADELLHAMGRDMAARTAPRAVRERAPGGEVAGLRERIGALERALCIAQRMRDNATGVATDMVSAKAADQGRLRAHVALVTAEKAKRTRALRIAVRCILEGRPITDALAEIAAVDPGLASEAFAYPERFGRKVAK